MDALTLLTNALPFIPATPSKPMRHSSQSKQSRTPNKPPLHKRVCTSMGRRVDEDEHEENQASLEEKFKRFLLEKLSERISQLHAAAALAEGTEEGVNSSDAFGRLNALRVALLEDRFENIDLTVLEGVEGGKKIKRGIVLLFMF